MTNLKRNDFRHRRPGAERGSFLLEALISILIVSFGILGLIGLQARAVQNIDDAQYRGEAAYLANGLLGQMWVYDKRNKPSTMLADLTAYYDNTGTGAGYTEFKSVVGQRLPGAALNSPKVTVTAGPTPNSANVLIEVYWLPPGEPGRHQTQVFGTIGFNN